MKEKGQARRSWYRLSLLFMLCFHESSVFIGSKSRQEDSERKVILSAKKKFELSTFIPESSVFIGSKSGQEDSERKVILSAKKKDVKCFKEEDKKCRYQMRNKRTCCGIQDTGKQGIQGCNDVKLELMTLNN
ncbi:uncharacterized protein LOC110644486 isoform X1 [Hevea brasiliensis]|uniref:uncharacterized protein LOC110644486 isoform X1 n=1 Tax=Hevea brasiliensis TaxID=3981 RepID=UPI0025DBDDFB|nr:uncharacterized protein LOC110644486 isoform X1 [Hevea brasiliensis]XP_057996215.1 uncharacterized protein LOC110644486 isoform X1 [Hevea brasiliensis]